MTSWLAPAWHVTRETIHCVDAAGHWPPAYRHLDKIPTGNELTVNHYRVYLWERQAWDDSSDTWHYPLFTPEGQGERSIFLHVWQETKKNIGLDPNRFSTSLTRILSGNKGFFYLLSPATPTRLSGLPSSSFTCLTELSSSLSPDCVIQRPFPLSQFTKS